MSKEKDQPLGRIRADCREANVPFPQNLVNQFERVALKLNETWGRPLTADYLQDLIFPSRPGRRGFPPEVAEEILTLKNLHEERYASLLETVWDPFNKMHRDSGKGDNKAKNQSASVTEGAQASKASIYSTRSTVAPPAAKRQRSATVASLLPETVRDHLEKISASRSVAEQTSRVPVPEYEADEMLLDAERLLAEEHIKSGTALLEVLTTVHPDYSPYTYLRLMEIYYYLDQRPDYDWVSQRLCEQFKCEKVEWGATSEEFTANADRVAQMFIFL